MTNVKCFQVGLILLAAGESKRMGTPKQLLSYKGRSLIRHAATEAIGSNCDRVVVVLGANSDRIFSELDNLPVHVCQNERWQKGMSTSIAMGIKVLLEINSNLNAVIVALTDQPLITAKVYNQLIERYRYRRSKAIASIYSQTIGVPALFPSNLFAELCNIQGKGGAKRLLQYHSNPKYNLTVPEAAIDIDTPTDYQHLLDL